VEAKLLQTAASLRTFFVSVISSVRIDDAPDDICYLRKVFYPSKMRCSLSVSSSAGNIDSMRNSCAATVCGVPTVVTIEK
jgi:hypothetical protein